MECLFPKKEKRGSEERLNAILDELEGYHHYEDYEKRFKLLFEFYQLEDLLR